jgi:hypothetical protein
MALARRITFAQLASALEILSEADARLKGILTGFTPIDTLERMVIEMAAAVNRT